MHCEVLLSPITPCLTLLVDVHLTGALWQLVPSVYGACSAATEQIGC